jgi:hypothetical protein
MSHAWDLPYGAIVLVLISSQQHTETQQKDNNGEASLQWTEHKVICFPKSFAADLWSEMNTSNPDKRTYASVRDLR